MPEHGDGDCDDGDGDDGDGDEDDPKYQGEYIASSIIKCSSSAVKY